MVLMKVAPVAFQVVLEAADLQRWPVPAWARSVVQRANGAPGADAEETWIDTQDLDRLYRALMASSGRPDLGLLLGSSPAVVRYGSLPSLIMNAPNLQGIIEVIIRYAALAQERSEVSLEIAQPCSTLYVDPIGCTPEGRRCRLEFILVGLTMIWRLAGGGDTGIERVCLPYDRPEHAAAYPALLDGELVFGAPRAALVFRSDMLGRCLPGADPVMFESLRLRADQALASLWTRRGCVEALTRVLETCLHERPRMADVAARMHLHERTLRHQLRQQGRAYNDVLVQVEGVTPLFAHS